MVPIFRKVANCPNWSKLPFLSRPTPLALWPCSSSHQKMENISPLSESWLAVWFILVNRMWYKWHWVGSRFRFQETLQAPFLPLGTFLPPYEQSQAILIDGERHEADCPPPSIIPAHAQNQDILLTLSWPQIHESARPRTKAALSWAWTKLPTLSFMNSIKGHCYKSLSWGVLFNTIITHSPNNARVCDSPPPKHLEVLQQDWWIRCSIYSVSILDSNRGRQQDQAIREW